MVEDNLEPSQKICKIDFQRGRNINTLEMSKVISPTFKYSPHLIRFGVTLIIGLWHQPPLFDYHDGDDDDGDIGNDDYVHW